MKVIVPVKRVVDSNVKVRVKDDGSGVELGNAKMSMNPFDEIAVEEAVRLKEKGVLPSEVVVVSCGGCPMPRDAAHCNRRWRRPGDPYRNRCGTPSRSRLPSSSRRVVDKEQPQLVILGKQAIDDDCNQTGQMLAALLELGTGNLREQGRGRRSRGGRPPAKSMCGWKR